MIITLNDTIVMATLLYNDVQNEPSILLTTVTLILILRIHATIIKIVIILW